MQEPHLYLHRLPLVCFCISPADMPLQLISALEPEHGLSWRMRRTGVCPQMHHPRVCLTEHRRAPRLPTRGRVRYPPCLPPHILLQVNRASLFRLAKGVYGDPWTLRCTRGRRPLMVVAQRHALGLISRGQNDGVAAFNTPYHLSSVCSCLSPVLLTKSSACNVATNTNTCSHIEITMQHQDIKFRHTTLEKPACFGAAPRRRCYM